MQRTTEGFISAEPKTARSRRRITLGPTAVEEALRYHRTRQLEQRLRVDEDWEDNDLVFSNNLGRPMEAGNLMRRSFWPLLERAGLPRIRFHDLRHTATCATRRPKPHGGHAATRVRREPQDCE